MPDDITIDTVQEKFSQLQSMFACYGLLIPINNRNISAISYDKLGDFCLTVKGHGECVRYVKSFGLPMMLLGGGGYTIENVSRCWTYETGIALDEDLPNEMPITDYYTKYGPEYKLHQKPANHPNLNEKKFLDELIAYNIESLKELDRKSVV